MSTRKRILWIVLSSLLSLIMFASCAPGGQTAQNTGANSKVVFLYDKTNFSMVGGDPATMKGNPSIIINSNVFESLVRRDKDNKIQPCLAESWQWAPDNLSIVFNLRKGIKFQNGDSFSAPDVKFTFEQYLKPEKAFAYSGEQKRNIKEIQVIDDYTVKFVFNEIFPAFFDRLADCYWMVPRNYYAKDEKYFTDHPVGTGPYKWVDYQQDVYLNLEAVPNHWRQTPSVKYLTIKWVPEASTRLAMLKTGEADMAVVALANVKEVQSTPGLKITWLKNIYADNLVFADLIFTDQKLPWQDPKVRQAASLAIDRQAICDKVLFGAGRPYGDIIPPWMPGYDVNAAKPPPYDLAQAKKLMAESGYPNGFETQLICRNSEKPQLEAVASYLAQIGIKVNFKLVDDSGWTKTIFGKKDTGLIYLMHYWSGRTHIFPVVESRFAKSSQWAYIINDTTEAAVNEVRTILPDAQMAKVSRDAIDKIKAMNMGIILFAVDKAIGVGSRIKYWEPVAGDEIPILFEYMTLK